MSRSRTAVPAALVVAFLAAPATAEVIVQQAALDLNPNVPNPLLTFDGFDDLGGARQLEAVTVAIDADLTAVLEFANFGASPVAGGTWSGEFIYQSLLLFGGFGGDGPLVGLGGISDSGITGDLGAGTGSPFGPPGTPTVVSSLTDTITSTVSVADSMEFFITTDSIDAVASSFIDVLVTPPPVVMPSSSAPSSTSRRSAP